MWGKESLCNIGQKRDKKKERKKNITYVPVNGAMAVVGVGAKGRMQWWCGGLHAHGQGCMHQCFDGLLDPPWTSWGQLVLAGTTP